MSLFFTVKIDNAPTGAALSRYKVTVSSELGFSRNLIKSPNVFSPLPR